MKDKPLGFQIWFAMTILMLFVAVAVASIMVWLIESSTGMELSLADLNLAGNLSRLLLSFVIFNIIFAKVLASRITEPLRYLERRVRYIANKDWSMPIRVERKDEIGMLALSIGRMQENLQRMESEEEVFLQTISHDLKTPVMIIRSYCQAIQDGVYLDGSLEKMVAVVESEALRLENKISKLLFLNSLAFELQRSGNGRRIDLRDLAEKVVSRFLFRRREIKVTVAPGTAYIDGVAEKIEVAVENLIDNGLRYAATVLEIEIIADYPTDETGERRVALRISNDGETIEEVVRERLFQRFFKGSKGDFGLGLYIAKRIVDHHRGCIWAENQIGKVNFFMVFPASRQQ